MNCFMFLICCSTNPFMKHMYSSFTPNLSRHRSVNCTHGIRVHSTSTVSINYLAKLARFCITFATNVNFRAVFSSGYSVTKTDQEKAKLKCRITHTLSLSLCSPWHNWNRLGDKMAGQKNRKKMDPLISLKQASSLSAPNLCLMP